MSSKLEYLQQKKLNPADELRELLSSLEEQAVKIKGISSTQALFVLRDLDQLYTLFDQLTVAGLDLLAEEGRFKALQGRVRQSAGPLLKALGGASVLAEHRPMPAPSRERWWWYIHERVAAQRQRRFRRLTIFAVILAGVIGGMVVLFNTVLAPSPEAVARLEAENAAYAAMEAGDLQAALAAIEAGLTHVPDDPNMLLLKGVLQSVMGQEAEAERIFAQVEFSFGPRENFYLQRSQLEMRAKRLDEAEANARQALALDENSAAAWLLLGQSLEAQGQGFEAIRAYEMAGDLAFENGNNQIVVLARLALARLGSEGISPQ